MNVEKMIALNKEYKTTKTAYNVQWEKCYGISGSARYEKGLDKLSKQLEKLRNALARESLK